jgi:excinuclease UvrABC nuclease subunit
MSADQPVSEFLSEALPSAHSWAARPTSNDLAALPGCPAVFLLVDGSGKPIQLLTTQQLKRVVISRLSEPEEARRGRTDLAEVTRGVRWRQVHSPFEARWWYYRLARVLHPGEYRKLVSFGPAWFLHVNWSRRIPEMRVTERIWRIDGEFVGPWPIQKSCQQALEGLWDVFELCRYPEQVRKAPGGSPCAYADMGRCDAPCDGSVPLERYVERSRAAWRFATGAVPAWIQSATQRMKEAADGHRYELAGQLKRQLEFAQTWRRRWLTSVCREEELNFLLGVPATRRKAWKLFLFERGHLIDGPLLADRKLSTETPAWLGDALRQPLPELNTEVRMEQTWLVAHFLQHKDARNAIVEHLPDVQVPPDLEASLRDALKQRRNPGEAPGEPRR